MADNLCVGVYSRSLEMRSIASFGAFRNTWIVSTAVTMLQGYGQQDFSYLRERMGLDLGELVLHVIRVHSADLLAGWGSQNLDNLHKLVDTRFTGEKRLTKH